MLKGSAGSEGKGMEAQRFCLPLGLPRATRILLTCGWRGCRTWQGNIPRGATTPSLPSAWCTLQPWWLSTWACWRTGNTSLWAVWHSRWASSSLKGFWICCWATKCFHVLPQTVLTVCCMNEMLLCENRNVYFKQMLFKNRCILYIHCKNSNILQIYSTKIDIFDTHYKNGNIWHTYSIKIETHILHIYSTKIESYILYIYTLQK